MSNNTRILTELEAREAAINGHTVAYRRSPPYLPCALCQGNGTGAFPHILGCPGPHPTGWEILEQRTATPHEPFVAHVHDLITYWTQLALDDPHLTTHHLLYGLAHSILNAIDEGELPTPPPNALHEMLHRT